MKTISATALLIVLAGLFAACPAFAGDAGTMDRSMDKQATGTIDSASMSKHGAGTTGSFHARELLGKTVKTKQGETLGVVEDVVIGRDGSAEFVILSYGGAFGFGEKYASVPFETFMSSAEDMSIMNAGEEVIANLDRDKLESAPGFSGKERDGSFKGSRDMICSYSCPGAFPTYLTM